jgi:hypothetical protein
MSASSHPPSQNQSSPLPVLFSAFFTHSPGHSFLFTISCPHRISLSLRTSVMHQHPVLSTLPSCW